MGYENKSFLMDMDGVIFFGNRLIEGAKEFIELLNAHGNKLANPKIIALINIDGTDSTMLSTIGSNDVHKDFTEVKVKAVMKPKGKREGTIKDILYFEEI